MGTRALELTEIQLLGLQTRVRGCPQLPQESRENAVPYSPRWRFGAKVKSPEHFIHPNRPYCYGNLVHMSVLYFCTLNSVKPQEWENLNATLSRTDLSGRATNVSMKSLTRDS